MKKSNFVFHLKNSFKRIIGTFTVFVLLFSFLFGSGFVFAEEDDNSGIIEENSDELSKGAGTETGSLVPENTFQIKFKNENIDEIKKQKLLDKLQKSEKKELHQKLRQEFKNQQKTLKEINENLKTELDNQLLDLSDEEKGLIEYIEPNYFASAQAITPNDTEYSNQWALPKIQASEAWQTSTGSEAVTIAVLDTGISFNHPDKPINIKSGYDFINNDNNPSDDHGHGTFISGLISANSNNQQGITGTCWNCTIMPIKVLDEDGLGTYEDVANGIKYAADNGANVINLSLGGYGYSENLHEAVDYAVSKNVVLIAAGGNSGTNDVIFPAGFPNVIGVSATDQNDERWGNSNYGTHIDISAPGTDIYGLALDSGYKYLTGTSMSTALVSGAVGLLVSSDSSLSAEQIKNRLLGSTIDLGASGRDDYFGEGRLDLRGLFSEESQHEVAEEVTQNPADLKEGVDIDWLLMEPRQMAFGGLSTKSEIQKFLETQPGNLKNYTDTFPPEYNANGLVDAGAILSYANTIVEGGPKVSYFQYRLPEEMLMVILELKSQAITRTDLTQAEIDNILEFDMSKIEKDFEENFVIKEGRFVRTPPSLGDIITPEISPKIFYQIAYLNTKIGYEKYKIEQSIKKQIDENCVQKLSKEEKMFKERELCYGTDPNTEKYYFGYWSMDKDKLEKYVDLSRLDTTITFKDGTSLNLGYKPALYSSFTNANYADVFAIKKVLAEMADSREQWEKWMGYGEGSFYDLYSRWFGFRASLFSKAPPETASQSGLNVQSETTIQPPAEDFLKWGYNKNNHSYFTSFFDHSNPNYSKNDQLVTFTSDVFSSVYPSRTGVPKNITNGYNSYDGHNGIDFVVNNTSDEARKIVAVADGVIIIKNWNDDYGYQVKIAHDIDQDGRFDYITHYAHLKSGSLTDIPYCENFDTEVKDECRISAGDKVGVMGETGTNGVHLHFDVRKILYTEITDTNGIVTYKKNLIPPIMQQILGAGGGQRTKIYQEKESIN